ncbi:unnamed protein product [Camellia sinensis]
MAVSETFSNNPNTRRMENYIVNSKEVYSSEEVDLVMRIGTVVSSHLVMDGLISDQKDVEVLQSGVLQSRVND